MYIRAGGPSSEPLGPVRLVPLFLCRPAQAYGRKKIHGNQRVGSRPSGWVQVQASDAWSGRAQVKCAGVPLSAWTRSVSVFHNTSMHSPVEGRVQSRTHAPVHRPALCILGPWTELPVHMGPVVEEFQAHGLEQRSIQPAGQRVAGPRIILAISGLWIL